MFRTTTVLLFPVLSAVGCGGDDDELGPPTATGGVSSGAGATGGGGSGGGGMTAGTGGVVTGPITNGCPTYPQAVATAADYPAGDTWDAFAQDFFATYCTRCHSTALADPDSRTYAPAGRNWDDAVAVRTYLADIRLVVGEENSMPPDGVAPSCDERLRLVRWIDLGAP